MVVLTEGLLGGPQQKACTFARGHREQLSGRLEDGFCEKQCPLNMSVGGSSPNLIIINLRLTILPKTRASIAAMSGLGRRRGGDDHRARRRRFVLRGRAGAALSAHGQSARIS